MNSTNPCDSYINSHPKVIPMELLFPLDFSKDCSWFDEYLSESLYSPSNSTAAAILKSALPVDLYDDNLVSCYRDYYPHYLPEPVNARVLECCNCSVYATGDPDLGGVRVRFCACNYRIYHDHFWCNNADVDSLRIRNYFCYLLCNCRYWERHQLRWQQRFWKPLEFINIVWDGQ